MSHSTSIRSASASAILALLLVLLTPLLGLAQSPAASRPNDPSPALGHAQVIAHGVATLPRGDLAWRLRLDRAPLPNRAVPEPRPAGFVAADAGVVAIAAANGDVLSRVPPGEAAWLPPESPQAVISLERQPVAYLDFGVVRATEPSARDLVGSAFPAPPGQAYDIVLLRDVLTRGEESDLATVNGPAFLYVSSGRITLEDARGAEIDLAAGDVAEFTGNAVAVGTGRNPASFLVAMIGPEVPRAVELRQQTPVPPPVQPTMAPALTPTPTPQPTATPVPTASPTATPLPPTATPTATPLPPTATPSPSPTPQPTATATPVPTVTPTPAPTATPTPAPEPGVIAIAARICPAGYPGADFAADCTDPAAAVPFVLAAGHAVIDTINADEAGDVRFTGVIPGSYQVGADIPGDFAASQVECFNAFGDRVGQPQELNQIGLDIAAGDDIACDWYIVPENARGLVDLSVLIRACPEGMTPEDLVLTGEACPPAPAGTMLTLMSGGEQLGPASALPDAWQWSALEPGAYGLDVAALPPGFADAQLDDQPCCGVDGDFSIDLAGEQAEESRTLYLFQPAEPEPEPAPDTSVTVDIAMCPAGMSVETLDSAACSPAPAGTSLSLFVGNEQVEAATAEDAQWVWQGLPYGPATLVVNAVPEGTATFSLNQRTCCNIEGGLDVSVSEETPHTGYTFYLYPPPPPVVEETPEPEAAADVPQDAPEAVEVSDVDPDGDGLPSTDEAFFQTDPDNADTDGDGVDDAAEIAAGTDPLQP